MSTDSLGSILSRFRPAPRQRVRIAVGAVLVAIGIVGNVVAYSSLDRRVEVLQLVTDVRAGSLVTADVLRVVAVDVDPTVPVVAATDLASVVDRHARVHLVAGSLISPVLVQVEPLVSPTRSVVAIEVRPTLVPTGVRERSRIELIVAPDGRADDDIEVFRTIGRVVTRPSEVDGITGLVSMSVEIDTGAAAPVAAADDVRIVLLDPGVDEAYSAVADGGGG